MTEYEMRKIAKYQSEYLVEALKEDDELLNLMFPPKLLNIEEAAELLRIPVGTLYHKADEIPHKKVGKRLIFTDRALLRWLNRREERESKEIPIDIKLKKVM